jgi:hypothetical protein
MQVTWLATFVAHNIASNIVRSIATCVHGWLVRVITPLRVIIGANQWSVVRVLAHSQFMSEQAMSVLP